jgi:hypothetical protein
MGPWWNIRDIRDIVLEFGRDLTILETKYVLLCDVYLGIGTYAHVHVRRSVVNIVHQAINRILPPIRLLLPNFQVFTQFSPAVLQLGLMPVANKIKDHRADWNIGFVNYMPLERLNQRRRTLCAFQPSDNSERKSNQSRI